jgi:hypothetical protein
VLLTKPVSFSIVRPIVCGMSALRLWGEEAPAQEG